MNIFLSQPHFGPRKILWVHWLVEPNLHSYLHHDSTQHKGGIRAGSLGRKRPCAKQAQCFHNVVVGLDLDCLPDEIRQRLLEPGKQSTFALVMAGGHADNGPEEQLGVLGTYIVGGARRVEKWKEWMVQLEEVVEELIDLSRPKPDISQGVEHGRAAAQIQEGCGSNLLVLGLQECIILLCMYMASSEDMVFCRWLRGVQHGLVWHCVGPAFVQGKALPQLLHLALHFGIAVALPHALEVRLDNAFEVLLLAACAALEGILLDIALELCARESAGARHEGAKASDTDEKQSLDAAGYGV